MKILLSIKPQYAEKIFSREKRFEFRKTIFTRNVTTVIVYASSPCQRIIGEFDIEAILKGQPSDIWEQTKEYAGITKEDFFRYFDKKQVAFALQIGNVRKYQESINPYTEYKHFFPPQSFCYVTES